LRACILLCHDKRMIWESVARRFSGISGREVGDRKKRMR
jgi:hypothetical protein